jgi:hypothetical protein
MRLGMDALIYGDYNEKYSLNGIFYAQTAWRNVSVHKNKYGRTVWPFNAEDITVFRNRESDFYTIYQFKNRKYDIVDCNRDKHI